MTFKHSPAEPKSDSFPYRIIVGSALLILVSFSLFAYDRWSVVSTYGESLSQAALTSLIQTYLAIGLFAICAFSMISLFVIWRIKRSLAALRESIESATSGEDTHTNELENYPEIVDLARAVDELIKAKKENEIAFRQSNKQMELVLESTAVGIWDWNITTGETIFNERWAQIVGYTLEELQPVSLKTWSSLAHPIDLKKSEEHLQRHWRGETERYEFQSRMRHKKGHWVWVYDAGRVVEWSEKGQPLRMVGTHLDITEQKEAEAELTKLSRIASQSTNGVVITDIKGLIEWVNEGFTRITGYELDEIRGKKPGEILQGSDTSLKSINEIRRALANQSAFHVEILNYQKDGTPYWVDIRCNPLRTSEGKLEGFMAIETDITEQKLTNIKLQNQQDMLEQMSAQGRIGAWELDMISGELYWSAMTKEIHEVPQHYKPQLDTAINFYKEGESRDFVTAAVQKGIEKGEPWNLELKLITARGNEIWVAARGEVVMVDGTCTRLFGSFQDISEKKETETKLIQAKNAAESAAQAKTEFLASMSHEIRTPMNGVIGMLNLLNKSQLDKNQKQQVDVAKSSARSLLSLINDILDFSKVEAGKLDIEFIDFELRSHMDDFIHTMALKAEEKDIELILDLRDLTHSWVKGDPGRLRQIFTNLVGNAIKFTSSGEIVVYCAVAEQGGNLLLHGSVTDTGIGIPSEKASSLFDSFTQVDASTTRKYGGTGLGLAIVKKLCKLMGGDISVSSEINKGSRFDFNVIFQKSTQVSQSMPSISIDKLHIMIVADNRTNREVLSEQLEQLNAKVSMFENGSEAINYCQKNSNFTCDIVILDQNMPRLDGAELCKQLRSYQNMTNTKFIVMTSISQRGDATTFAEQGFDAYFVKPATRSDILAAIQVVAEGGDALKSATPLVTKHYLKSLITERNQREEFLSQQFHVLLVEDNVINQEVAIGLLEDIGIAVDIASNGNEAIERLSNTTDSVLFHLVLMDCQMPELDGYQTTKQIRAGKAGDKYTHIPIIAMTANAMKGDKEKCFDVGMDDYLSKPIDTEDLEQKLEKWLQGKRNENDIQVATENDKGEELWNKANALARVRGKDTRLRALTNLFVDEIPEVLSALCNSVKDGKAHDTKDIAHQLKGISGNMSANQLFNLATKIEQLAKEDNLVQAELLLPELKDKYARTETLLKQYLHTQNQ